MSLINAEAFLDGMRDLYAKAGWDPKEVHFSLNDLIANIEGEPKVDAIDPSEENFGFAACVTKKDGTMTRVRETWGSLEDKDLLAVFIGFIMDIKTDPSLNEIWLKADNIATFYRHKFEKTYPQEQEKYDA